jgi:flagellar hook assembly protein FlgD
MTTIRYDLPQNSFMTIIIYDMLGREVNTLVQESQTAGNKSVIWYGTDTNGKPVSSGIYFYQIQAGEYLQTKKIVLLK